MNVSSERTRSVWMDTAVLEAPVLDREERADVVVIGTGIAGLSTAYELTRRGRSVVVLDRGPIGGGMTARTTAHLASTCDDFYHALIALRGLEQARVHYVSHAAAIDNIEKIQRDEAIACDFQRLDGYLFAPPDSDGAVLERELEAARQIGLQAEWEERAPLPGIEAGRCLRFPAQGRMHPLKYLRGLAAAIQQNGGRFYADTRVDAIEESGGTVKVETACGHAVHARAAVVATNSPIHDRLAIHSKQAPYRTYVIAGPVARGAVPDALYWDTHDPYHYVRLQPGTESDLLIVGGEDHRTGEADDGEARFAALEAWARRYFPALQAVTHRWSGQVLEPVDYAAFIGRNPGSESTFMATGDSGQGITGGVVAGLLITDLIVDGSSPWAEFYDPARKPLGAAAEYVRENLTTVKNFAEYVTGGDVSSAEALAPGQGAVIRQGLKKIAAYRDPQGELHLQSAVCTHMGCIVHWNSLEGCWDCPCHGSHFAPDGRAINGPAVAPLAKVET